MRFGMYCAQTGAHREATCASQALDVWQNAPKTEGNWYLVIDHKVVQEEEVDHDGSWTRGGIRLMAIRLLHME